MSQTFPPSSLASLSSLRQVPIKNAKGASLSDVQMPVHRVACSLSRLALCQRNETESSEEGEEEEQSESEGDTSCSDNGLEEADRKKEDIVIREEKGRRKVDITLRQATMHLGNRTETKLASRQHLAPKTSLFKCSVAHKPEAVQAEGVIKNDENDYEPQQLQHPKTSSFDAVPRSRQPLVVLPSNIQAGDIGFKQPENNHDESMLMFPQFNALTKVCRLDRKECSTLTDVVLQQLGARCTSIVTLAASNWTISTPAKTTATTSSPLVTFTNLASLSLSAHSSLRALDLKCVAQHCFSTLTSLRLNNSNVDGEGLQYITDHCSRLQSLCLGNTRNLVLSLQRESRTRIAISSISRCTRLHTLDLSGMSLSDSIIIPLLRSCSLLTQLQLADCNLTNPAVEAISNHCAHLRTLNLSMNPISSSLRSLSRLSSLKHLFLDGCILVTDDCTSFVCQLPKLTVLSITGRPQENGLLTNKCLELWAQNLDKTKLRVLYLDGQRLSRDGVAKLCRPSLTVYWRSERFQAFSEFAVTSDDEWDWAQFRGKHIEDGASKQTVSGVSSRYSHFEKQWQMFIAQAASTTGTITLSEISWPSDETDLFIDQSLSLNKRRMRELILRWHPDKFLQQFRCCLKQDEISSIREHVNRVFHLLTFIKQRWRNRGSTQPA